MAPTSSPLDDDAPDAAANREHAALSAFRHLARSQPASMLSILLTDAERFDDPSRALDILDDCGSDVGEALAKSASENSKNACSELASLCSYHEPASLDRLSRSLPGLWLLVNHGNVFRSLADALGSSWEAPDDAARDAARMATGWIGAGLSPPAWRELSNQGGPAWRAFRDVHAQAARADPSRSIAPSDMGGLSWKGAARVALASGMTGYGLHGAWTHGLSSKSPCITDRLGAALGLRELFFEMKAATLSLEPEASDARSKSLARLGEALSSALDHDAAEAPWSGFLHRALQSLPALGLAPSDIICPIPAGYGLPTPVRTRLVDASMRSKSAGSASLPNFLSMNRAPALRALGLELGSDAAASFSSWHAAILSSLPTRTSLHPGFHSVPAGPPSEEILSVIEAQDLSMASDATRWAQGHGLAAKARARRI